MNDVIIDDHVFKALIKKLGSLASKPVRVGVLGSGGAEDHEGITMLELATIHELGNRNMKPRSFIRSTFERADVKTEQSKVSKELAKQIISGKMPIDQALSILGAWGVDQVKLSISGRKIRQELKSRSGTALIDTGRMINAINFEVKK